MAARSKATGKAGAKGTKGTGRTRTAYLKSLEPARRKQFQELREIVCKGLPAARETMSYGMPTWEVEGRPLVAAASQKRNLALYFMTENVLDRHRDAFSHLDVGKCCIRFRKLEDLPGPTLKKITAGSR